MVVVGDWMDFSLFNKDLKEMYFTLLLHQPCLSQFPSRQLYIGIYSESGFVLSQLYRAIIKLTGVLESTLSTSTHCFFRPTGAVLNCIMYVG